MWLLWRPQGRGHTPRNCNQKDIPRTRTVVLRTVRVAHQEHGSIREKFTMNPLRDETSLEYRLLHLLSLRKQTPWLLHSQLYISLSWIPLVFSSSFQPLLRGDFTLGTFLFGTSRTYFVSTLVTYGNGGLEVILRSSNKSECGSSFSAYCYRRFPWRLKLKPQVNFDNVVLHGEEVPV